MQQISIVDTAADREYKSIIMSASLGRGVSSNHTDSATQPLNNLLSHGKEGRMNRFIGTMATVFGLLFTGLVAQAGAVAIAGAPEIDPGVASSAIGLLTCGLLMLTAKRKRRKEDR
jgi:hypothetical protein